MTAAASTTRPPLSRQGAPAATHRWYWAGLSAAFLVTGLVAWLHFQQRLAFEREAAQQRHVRQARVILNRGFVLASLGSDPAHPFNRDEGRTLIRQSIADFTATLKDVEPEVRQTAAAFRHLANDLESSLDRWDAEASPENAAALRIAFARLDRQTALIDAANETQLRELSASQTQVFAGALGGAALLLSAGLAALLLAARADARAAQTRLEGERRAAAAHAERARLLAETERAHQSVLKVVEEQKAAELALRKSEARYRSLIETSFDWVWEVDAECRYTYASPRVRELLGYEPEEMLGRTPFDFMPEAEARRVRRVFEELVAGRKPVIGLENTNRHRDGRLITVETNGLPLLAPDGTWLGYQGMDRDITARQLAERTLRLRGAALEAAANAIVITDRDGAIEWANRAFTALSGWTLAEAAGRNLHELVNSGQHDAAFFRRLAEEIYAGRVWHGEIVNRRKDGQLRTEEMTITPLADGQGEIRHCVAIKQDITERKLLEVQSRHAQRMEAIGTLAGGVSHDLNNILAPILLVSDLLLKHDLPLEKHVEMVQLLRQNARRGSDVVRQLLSFSRGVEGERIPVQPKHIVGEMLAIMRETFPRELELVADLPPTLPVVKADPTQLHQVLLNLCVNARDAMPEGGHLTLAATSVTLAAGAPELPPDIAPGLFVRLSVTDTGHGIPPEIQHRIFDPFFTTKPIGKGTGLGLATAQGIVRGHGGFITVESPPGRGTTFRVHLPSTEPVEPAEVPASPPLPSQGGGQTILIVDDERAIRQAFGLVLSHHGYRPLLAVNGKDGLAQFLEHREIIKLVLTDVMMPMMNGVALIKAIRALDPNLPILAASGLGDLDKGAELAALGVARVLAKPCPAEVLLAAVAEQLPPPAAVAG